MTERTRTTDCPRSATGREWEVFLRPEAADLLRHVGSVTAPNADVAHEQIDRLFPWSTRDIWLCPADEVRRYASDTLVDRAPGGTSDTGTGAGADP